MKKLIFSSLFVLFIISIVKIFPFVAIFLYDTTEHLKFKVNTEYKMEKVLSYVASHNGEIFDCAKASKELNIEPMQIYRALKRLNELGKIKATPKNYLRKPILISINDYEHFYFIVSIAASENASD